MLHENADWAYYYSPKSSVKATQFPTLKLLMAKLTMKTFCKKISVAFGKKCTVKKESAKIAVDHNINILDVEIYFSLFNKFYYKHFLL